MQSFPLRQDFDQFDINQLYYAWDKMQDILCLFLILMVLRLANTHKRVKQTGMLLRMNWGNIVFDIFYIPNMTC